MTIQFATVDGRSLRVRDTTESEQFTLRADRELAPEEASVDEFTSPVDAAVAIDAGELHFPVYRPAVFLEDGEVVHRTEDGGSSEWLDSGTYEIDASPPGAKTYVKVHDAAVRGRFEDDHTVLDIDPAARLVVGVRSHHERPAATVRTTEDPRDVMAAVSTFGSALKTQSPDRSWPTLRGHPPAIELGTSLAVPDAVAPPETGVTIEVPPEYGPIFTVAPLAYYLGATVEPGAEPRLRAAGATREFDPDALASEVAACLEHCFVLDGVVRTVGVYPFRHEQAEQLEKRVDLDHEALFDRPLDERTAAYLDVPRSATTGLVGWHLTADVAPEPRYATSLPYLVDELAIVRSPPPTPEPAQRAPDPDALARSLGQTTEATADVVVPDPVDTPGHAWVGEGFAVEAANPTVGSFRRGFEWPSGDAPLDVHVVYNDQRIDAPDELAYGNHPTAETNVRVSHSLTTAELQEALLSETDFLHFVGHVTERGMVCPDGELDVRTLPTTGVGAFFLNGCRSYEQGFALLTAGAAGGIVTVDDVDDENAGRIGQQATMLLDTGVPLYGVLDTLDRTGTDTSRYTVLGDPMLTLRRSTSSFGLVNSFDVDRGTASVDSFPSTAYAYPSGENSLGGHMTLHHPETGNHLLSARGVSADFSREQLALHFEEDTVATLLDGSLVLNTDLSLDDFDA
ncbi:hypothetical protein [Halobacterium jilantaiense]|uniref:CHAT domain-containing protein n=1 Tax=Halobacterium jilantaiense TaxID=355548 RepID=A0A1I0Q039_9EURY|nr:hypothetical protein [Halobacterium jilantaiense]SEW19852.1 hypothetical protein SAMN04487945_2114 [Halobacterium jilantaiense]